MLLMLLIAGLWTAGVLLVAGLCIAARRGDRESELALALAPEQSPPEPVAPAISARLQEPAGPAVRAAA
jgi:hypothetical protein